MSDRPVPPLMIEVAVEPRSKADQERMSAALQRLAQEDPSFRVAVDPESGQTVIKGIDEAHLEILVDRIKREFKVDANVGAPQVAYRETITRRAEIDHTYRKQTGGSGRYARVKLVFEPLPAGSGYQFESAVIGGTVPREYISGVEQGLSAARETGVIAGFPVIDFKATLIDGAYHDADSSVPAFDIASRAAFREGLPKAGPMLLEPIMSVEVVTPEETMGDVIGDLNRRRGRILGMGSRGDAGVVSASVPLANMFGYAGDLQALGRGQARFTMRFERYAPFDSDPGDGPFRPAAALRA